MDRLTLLFFSIIMSLCHGAIPGTFFWKPRLGLDLASPTTELDMFVQLPNYANVMEGVVVMVDGYQAGAAIVAFASGVSSARTYPHLNLLAPHFYTNSYRWALRHLSLMPFWLGGNSGSYCDTHRVWRRRFFYMDEFLPKWLRHLFPYVKAKEWEKEIEDYKLFQRYSESAFARNYAYPHSPFDNFRQHRDPSSESSSIID